MNIDSIDTNTVDDDSMEIDSPAPADTELPSDVPPPPTHLVHSLQKRSNVYLDKLIRAAEKRTAQLATLLSPIAEEPDSKPSSPGFGLGLSIPVLDFPSFKSNLDAYGQKSLVITNEELAGSFERGVRTSEGFEERLMDLDGDEEMLSPLSGSEASSTMSTPSVMSPRSSGEGGGVFVFDFGDAGDGNAPPSPRRGAWDWGVGGTGVAVSTPVKKAV